MKFVCKLSGTIIEFTQEQDIKTTLENPAYEEYVAPVVKEEKPKKEVKVEPKE